MGLQHSKAGTAGQEAAAARSAASSKTSKRATSAAFRAVDARSVNKLWKALSVGAEVGSVRRSVRRSSATSISSRTRSVARLPALCSMSLIEYAVDKNFHTGVAIMLTVHHHHHHLPAEPSPTGVLSTAIIQFKMQPEQSK